MSEIRSADLAHYLQTFLGSSASAVLTRQFPVQENPQQPGKRRCAKAQTRYTFSLSAFRLWSQLASATCGPHWLLCRCILLLRALRRSKCSEILPLPFSQLRHDSLYQLNDPSLRSSLEHRSSPQK